MSERLGSPPDYAQRVTGIEVVPIKPKRPRLTRRDHWRLFKRDLRLAWEHLRAFVRGK
jgi:hypothetical protein